MNGYDIALKISVITLALTGLSFSAGTLLVAAYMSNYALIVSLFVSLGLAAVSMASYGIAGYLSMK